MIEKNLIVKHFSKSAREYELLARIQRFVACELMLKIPEGEYRTILDIGCGTGFLTHLLSDRFPEAHIVGIDIAPEMVAVAEESKAHKELTFEVGDGEELAFSDKSFDLVVSSSSFQWMRIEKAFNEVKRVLADNGRFCFACFGSRTLNEVKQIFGEDSVHELPSHTAVEQALSDLEFSDVDVVSILRKENYSNAYDLVFLLKSLGVQNATRRGLGLGGRRNFARALSDYESRFSDYNGVYASYEVIFGSAGK